MKFLKALSSQPRKQRKAAYNAPLHRAAKSLHAHLSRELRKAHGRRSARVRKGDRVKVLSGGHRGAVGTVSRVFAQEGKVALEGAVARKQAGREVPASIPASSLVITQLAEKHFIRKEK
ncbi:50S ribosomal protein L24 [Candidatus Micrarchaeota archaeon]|nr:50S ribosomal protein L24 [Candidatus Micrarchaeota archaeon]MBI5177367.1 50S ribosomal protein L24 [Candidatus Micrarchaeota archaeon]